MKKLNKSIVIIIVIALIAIIGLGFATYMILHDENKLSVEEKEWLAANINTVQNVHVLNNIDVFGKNGKGVFFDFIESFEEKYSIDVNPITYNSGEAVDTKAFKVVDETTDNQSVFYEEHYVIISKEKYNFSSISQLSNKKIGVLTADEKTIANYLNTVKDIKLTPYETQTTLLEALGKGEEIELAIIPLEENLSSILTSNYNIDYHISDLEKYFIYDPAENDIFSSILTKYFASWSKKNLDETIDENQLETFVDALSISDKELTSIQAKTYNYGFINNSPYEVLISGTYGGIVSEYLSRFSNFSNTEFTFIKYKSFNKFTEAIANKKIDLFYNYYNLETEYQPVNSLNNISFVIAAREDNNLIVNSINSLTDKTVYVLKNSILEKYLNEVGGIKIKTYADEKDLLKIVKKDNIIVLDEQVYNYYANNKFDGYNIRYRNTLSDTYNFYISSDDTFNILFNKYIQTLDPQEIRNYGLYNHSVTVKSGTILGKIAKYSLLIIAVLLVALYFAYRSSKKIKIAKKIKKEDKMKYIDQLTSLKNRNYLSENMNNWNKNTIYPQATIIVDLNQVQEINDSLGYEQGDTQIKAAANILIKTQLDNTDIMRTDGNEFLIYLVGYQEKQVVSYIRKLNKEFKHLPYEYGAAIGYSMILNDMKSISDAINESVEDMRNKKEEQEEG